MKHFNAVKLFLLIALGISGSAFGQTAIHPLAFGPHGIAGSTTNSDPMFYKDYVGARFLVTNPSAVAGEKQYTTSNDGGGGTGVWGGYLTSPIVDKDVIMCATDTLGCSIPAGSMVGKVAMIWRGNCEFGAKALAAQNAGAIACIIINQYAGMGPVGMGAGAVGASVTIPVFMVGNLDGVAMTSAYHWAGATGSGPSNVKVSITPWGQNLNNDLGFVPGGVAQWHNYAIPAAQFYTGVANNANAYKGISTAFIANYGSHPATNTKVVSTVSFTPTGGSASVQHRDTVMFAEPFTGVVSSVTDTLDSVMAMVSAEYALAGSGSSTGRFDATYTISSDSTEQFAGDNTTTASFYLSDSVFAKARYDFTAQKPLRNIYYTWGSGTEFVWGPFYYVAKGGSYVSKVQYALSASGTTRPIALSGFNDLLIFKWTDGANGNNQDSILQSGELELKAMGTYTFGGVADTADGDFMINSFVDPAGTAAPNVALDSDAWYYVAIDMTSSTSSQTQFLGCDGFNNPLPRIYGRGVNNIRNLEYSSIVLGTADDTATSGNFAPMPGTQCSFVNVIDSFNFPNVKGMIPSVALVTRGTAAPIDHSAVNNTNLVADKVSVMPNPATDYLDVAVEFNKPASSVTYKILDGLGRYVGKETVSNVTKETHRINTSTLPSGSYFLIIMADEKRIAKKFTVVR